MNKKAQSAMEYVMMHGWSLLIATIVGLIIIGIVVGAVVYFKDTPTFCNQSWNIFKLGCKR